MHEEVEREGNACLRSIALTTALLAALAALGSLEAGGTVNEALVLKTEATQLQAQASRSHPAVMTFWKPAPVPTGWYPNGVNVNSPGSPLARGLRNGGAYGQGCDSHMRQRAKGRPRGLGVRRAADYALSTAVWFAPTRLEGHGIKSATGGARLARRVRWIT